MHTLSELKTVLEYDEVTGLFNWLKSPKYNIPAGSIAGSPNKDGYILIMYKRKSYRASVLAWWFKTGGYHKTIIDHKDGIRANNAWSNLRESTVQQNNYNTKLRIDSSSGYKGVSWCKTTNKWFAQVTENKKRVLSKRFDNLGDAIEAVRIARETHHGKFVKHS